MRDKIETFVAISMIVLPVAFWVAIAFLVVHFVNKLW